MNGKSAGKFIPVLFLALLSIAKLVVLSGCANIIPPEGGPRDSLPPKLLHVTPADSTVNFHGRNITFSFDEYIDLQDVPNNLLFTPTFERNPGVTAKLKTLTVRMRDTLMPNTTYTLDFGNAIRDINEGNILKNFVYVFSTGPRLDSLELRGRVILAENGQTDSTIQVILHKDLTDSAVIKQRPLYVSRVDSNGYFHFRNLPADTFAIYALSDAGIMRRYQNKSQLFAFANSPVRAGSHDSIVLYAYREVPKNNQGQGGNAPVKSSNKRLVFTTNATGNQLDLLSDLVLTFATPLRSFDSSKISMSRDSSFTTVTGYTITEDTSRKELSFHATWAENTQYHLVLDKTFATDTAGRQLLKADTVNFMTKQRSDYGTLSIRIRDIDTARNPVLEFVQSDKVVYTAPIKSGFFRSDLFVPGDYELRILYDTNGNGKWDPGQFFGKKRQPEIAVPIKQGITVKAAWDNEFERRL